MADFHAIISAVKQNPGVVGSAIADANGQILINEIPDTVPELGTRANAIFSNIAVQIKRMERGTVKRLVLETENGITLLSGMSGGELLIIFVKSIDGFNLPTLLDTVSRY